MAIFSEPDLLHPRSPAEQLDAWQRDLDAIDRTIASLEARRAALERERTAWRLASMGGVVKAAGLARYEAERAELDASLAEERAGRDDVLARMRTVGPTCLDGHADSPLTPDT